jgi:3-hydroxyacyl-CoA dehydrogenase
VKPLLEQFKAAGKHTELTDDEIVFRAVSRFVNEAVYCVQDGVVASAVDADIASVFGIGFPPFVGGPFRWLDARGVRSVAERMQKLADTVGPQFAPAPLMLEHAQTNKRFHSS